MEASEYFQTLGKKIKDIWENIDQRIGKSDREKIIVLEQNIQDLLCGIFLPLVGGHAIPPYIEDELLDVWDGYPNLTDKESFFTLIGAHYRSPISLRGRRSAFIAMEENFLANLKRILPESDQESLHILSKNKIFPDFWQALFLDQYFYLFGKSNTFSEWVLKIGKSLQDDKKQQVTDVSIGVAVTEKETRIRWQDLGDGTPFLLFSLSKPLLNDLFSESMGKQFCSIILKSIAGVTSKNQLWDSGKDPESSATAPDLALLYQWLRLLRRSNNTASRLIQKSSLIETAESRCAYVTGMLQHGDQYRKFKNDLISTLNLPLETGEPCSLAEEHSVYTELSRIVKVLQAFQTYLLLYGDHCITVPLPVKPPSGLPYNTDSFPRCSLTLFWNNKGFQELQLTSILPCIRSEGRAVIDTLINHVVHPYFRTPDALTPSVDPGFKDILQSLKGIVQAETHLGQALLLVLRLALDLCRARHEGEYLSFSFMIGSPHHLVEDLEVEYEFLGWKRDGGNQEILTLRLDEGDLMGSYEESLAIVKGNSSFLQDPSLALFISVPKTPLEITHVVRIKTGQPRTRRAFLKYITEGKKKEEILAVSTYGNGWLEIFQGGEILYSYSPLHGWQTEGTFARFCDAFKQAIADLGEEFRAKNNLKRAPAEEADPYDEFVTIVEDILKRTSEESKAGALIVIAFTPQIDDLKSQSNRLTRVFDSIEGNTVEELGSNLLFQLATADGATLIDFGTRQVWGRWQLPVTPQNKMDKITEKWQAEDEDKAKDQAEDEDKAKDWYKILRWGTRHRTALGVSDAVGRNGIVIVVSADGEVNLMRSGSAIRSYGG